MKKKSLILLILMMVLIAAVGCDTDSMDPPDTGLEDQQEENEDKGIVDTEPEEESQEIVLYFVNKEYVITGDEDLDKLIPVKREVVIDNRPLEKIIISELQKTPEDERLDSSVEDLEILNVNIVENIANVDLSSQGLSGGSLQESLVLDQIIYTMTELPDVKAVQFLVDGKKTESLMGHFTIDQPLERE